MGAEGKRLGWPWPRQAYAEFVDFMNYGKANTVIFDVLFSEPSIYRNARQDEIIENTIKNLDMLESRFTEGEPRAAVPRRERHTGDDQESNFREIRNEIRAL